LQDLVIRTSVYLSGPTFPFSWRQRPRQIYSANRQWQIKYSHNVTNKYY
jgi:hypothetical protein